MSHKNSAKWNISDTSYILLLFVISSTKTGIIKVDIMIKLKINSHVRDNLHHILNLLPDAMGSTDLLKQKNLESPVSPTQ